MEFTEDQVEAFFWGAREFSEAEEQEILRLADVPGTVVYRVKLRIHNLFQLAFSDEGADMIILWHMQHFDRSERKEGRGDPEEADQKKRKS